MYRVKVSAAGGRGSAITVPSATEALAELNRLERDGHEGVEVYLRDGKLIAQATLEELARAEVQS